MRSYFYNNNNNNTLAPSRILNIILRAFASVKIPVTKEPSGLFRTDSKRPDGVTLIPWQRGLFLTWDLTVATTQADSYISASASSAGAAAEMAVSRKQAKYAALSGSHNPADCYGNSGPINESAAQFLNDLGYRIISVSADDKEGQFLFQRLYRSAEIQRYLVARVV